MARYKIPSGAGAWLDVYDGGRLKGGGSIVTVPNTFEPHVDWEPALINEKGELDEKGKPDPTAAKALEAIRAKHPGYLKREADRLESMAKAQEEKTAAAKRLAEAQAAAAPKPLGERALQAATVFKAVLDEVKAAEPKVAEEIHAALDEVMNPRASEPTTQLAEPPKT